MLNSCVRSILYILAVIVYVVASGVVLYMLYVSGLDETTTTGLLTVWSLFGFTLLKDKHR